MGRTLPLAARTTGARDGAGDRSVEMSLLHQCVEPQRRRVVETLCEEGSLSLDALADHVAARRLGCPVAAVPEDVREQVAIGLYHTHLQKLSETGVVEHSDDAERSTVTLSTGVEPERIRDLIRHGHGSWSALDALLSHERRLYVASHLASANGTLSLDELAETVAALECDDADSPADPESVRVSLHHTHLPKLDDAGVLSYDDERQEVALETLPDAYESIVAGDLEAIHA